MRGTFITLTAAALIIGGCNSKQDAEVQEKIDSQVQVLKAPTTNKTYASIEEEIADTAVFEVAGIVKVLDTVKDEASAKAAARYIEGAAKRLDALYEAHDGKYDEDKLRAEMETRKGEIEQLSKSAVVKVGKMFVFRSEEAQLLMTELEKIDWSFLDGPNSSGNQGG